MLNLFKAATRPATLRTHEFSFLPLGRHFSQVSNLKTKTLGKSQGRVIILGYQLFRKLNKKDYDVTVVSPSTAVGTLEFRAIVEPIRGYSKEVDYHQAWVDGIDVNRQVIQCTSNMDDSFEYAAQPNVTEAEKSAKLHFAVVGGGPTGVEFSSELYDFISEDLSRLYPELMDYTRMTVYDVGSSILNSFDSKLSDYATKKFNRRGIQIKTGTHVERVEKDYLDIKEEGKVPYGMLVWSTGLMQNPLVESLQHMAKDQKSHRIMTNSKLQVLNSDTNEPYPNVYALGDCATIEDYDLPATAQVANQKAIYLSKVLNNQIKGKPTEEGFSFKNMGSMAYIGSWKAVVDMTPVHKNAAESGFFAWLFWRSAYMSMSVSVRNKMLIPMYWLLTFACGRDGSSILHLPMCRYSSFCCVT
ncbi:hypothetical protein [Absidia glauca]|uniref:Uncharacterized protein n=1 Tax=Absidia glauca TaxID=4829 RepID=A0A168STG2_ABSGL|nr:hypothetical protein [Absidia glauca]